MPNTRATNRACVQAGLLLLLAGFSACADREVISLRHRSADQVMSVLRPLVEPGGAVSGANKQVVIRASRANLAQMRRALKSIDVAPRQTGGVLAGRSATREEVRRVRVTVESVEAVESLEAVEAIDAVEERN